jgi:hypothetical protein
MPDAPSEGEPPRLPSIPGPPATPAGSLSPDGLHYWDGAQWQSAISPDGYHYWNGAQWLPRQPQVVYAQPVIVQQRSSGAAKGCLIATGIGFVLLGGIFILTLFGFLIGVICIVIGVVMIVVGASTK